MDLALGLVNDFDDFFHQECLLAECIERTFVSQAQGGNEPEEGALKELNRESPQAAANSWRSVGHSANLPHTRFQFAKPHLEAGIVFGNSQIDAAATWHAWATHAAEIASVQPDCAHQWQDTNFGARVGHFIVL